MHLEELFLDHRARPDAVDQVVLGDEPAIRANQHVDDFERPATEGHDRPPHPQFPAGEIHFHVS